MDDATPLPHAVDSADGGSADEVVGNGAGADRVEAEPARRPRSSRDTSGPAIVATIALVAFSVFIGVYGPRLGNRQQLPAGTTLAELAQAVAARHAARVVQAIHVGPGSNATRDEIDALLGEALRAPAGLPEDAALPVRWFGAERVRLPGASGVQAFGRVRLDARTADTVSLFALRDEDRFFVFDGHGRPQRLPEGEVFSLAVPSDAANGVIHLYRDGDAVFAIESATAEVADLVLVALQEARARGEGSRPRGADEPRETVESDLPRGDPPGSGQETPAGG
ncbi:MAG: hypothetical protein RI967_2525 [Planctomycetota bacterium]|jgi:hypothetical protein